MEPCEKKIKVPTTGLFDFPELILGGKGKYIDKTALLYELASDADQQLFISRPRRFGKSLMLSTLKAMFEGRRDLFKGLAIDALPSDGWERPTPVYSFTMSSANGGTYEEFRMALRGLVEKLCAGCGCAYDKGNTIASNFDSFLAFAAEKSPTKKIVVLIDEYDEPVAKFLDDLETLKKVRSDLHDFYEKLIGSEISGERQSARGRADAILKDKSGVYVFEFKYGKTAQEALAQARTKDYAGPWLDGEPPVFYVGVNYDPAKRGIDDPLVEPA